MSAWSLMIRELRLRWLNFGLALFAVVAACALVIALTSMGRAANTETKRLMRNLGFNLLVLPQGTNLVRYWANDEVTGDMPQEYVTRLAQTRGIGADHYVATLQQRLEWRGLTVLLTGILPERNAVDAPGKDSMGYQIARGKCLLGYAVAEALNLREGGRFDLMGLPLQVERVLTEDGSKEDVRVYVHLADAQQLLRKPDRINTIQCLGCLCAGGALAIMRERIGKALPDTYVTELRNIAIARSDTRAMVEKNIEVIVTLVIGVCALWLAILAWLNVRERRQEIGLLRALGFGSWHMLVLFLGRAALIGLLGALIGFAAGTVLATHYGADVFRLTFARVRPVYDLLPRALEASVAIAALATLVPAMVAVTQDPAATLTRE